MYPKHQSNCQTGTEGNVNAHERDCPSFFKKVLLLRTLAVSLLLLSLFFVSSHFPYLFIGTEFFIMKEIHFCHEYFYATNADKRYRMKLDILETKQSERSGTIHFLLLFQFSTLVGGVSTSYLNNSSINMKLLIRIRQPQIIRGEIICS